MGDEQTTKRSLAVEEGQTNSGALVLKSMTAPVSPPRKRQRTQLAAETRAVEGVTAPEAGTGTVEVVLRKGAKEKEREKGKETDDVLTGGRRLSIRSPFQLTAIRDLPPADNVDTVTLRDVFGDPLIAECWEFNYLHDIDFLMHAFDEDVQHAVRVHVVHGFWKREDPRRQKMEQAAAQYENVQLHAAYLPEPFGTHHSKMAILMRHDDTAQVVIHTANLIPHDWANMTQGVWRSPLLPLMNESTIEEAGEGEGEGPGGVSGSGPRFKTDLLSYLRSYNKQRSICKPLVEELARYDFSEVRAALIASVPGRHHVLRTGENDNDSYATQWGWAAIKHTLKSVPLKPLQTPTAAVAPTEIAMQISSIATLGGTDVWLQKTLFPAFSGGKNAQQQQQSHFAQLQQQKPQFRVLFPTPDEVRRSLDGYIAGTSIHTKIQSQQQQKQLQYLRPIFCHWANDAPDGAKLPDGVPRRDGGRQRAAPHIKTYVRYGNDGIDWALLTSANLSKQAWGEAVTPSGDIRVSSYEIGVMVWPDLFAEGATMQATFRRDTVDDVQASTGVADHSSNSAKMASSRPVVALRTPYNLPLQRYGKSETPWVVTMPHDEPDWRGMSWEGR